MENKVKVGITEFRRVRKGDKMSGHTENDKDKSKEDEKYFVVFIDILGFKDMLHIYEDKLEEYQAQIERCVNECNKNYCKGNDNFQYTVSSDCAVIYAKEKQGLDVRKGNLPNVIKLCSRLFYELILDGIPIRGSISYGKLKVRKKDMDTIISGKAYNDAVENERNQDWVGIIITPKLLECKNFYTYLDDNSLCNCPNRPVPDSTDMMSPNGKLIPNCDIHYYFTRYRIPLKEKNVLGGFAVIPHSEFSLVGKGVLGSIKKHLIEEVWKKLTYLGSCSAKSQLKYVGALDFIEHVLEEVRANEKNVE